MTTKELYKKLTRVRARHSHTPEFFLAHAGRHDAKKGYVQKDTYGSYESEWIRQKGKYIEAASHKVFALSSGPVQEERARRTAWIEKRENLMKRRAELVPQLKNLNDLRGSEHRAQRKLHEEVAAIDKQLATIREELPKMDEKIRDIEFMAVNRAAQIRKETEAQVLIYLRAARGDLDEQASINFYFTDTAEELFNRYFN